MIEAEADLAGDVEDGDDDADSDEDEDEGDVLDGEEVRLLDWELVSLVEL